MNEIQKYFKNITPQKLVISVIFLVLMYIVLKKLWQYGKPSNYNEDSYIIGGGVIPSDWMPNEYTDSLYSAIQGWTFSPDGLDSVAEKVNKLTDNHYLYFLFHFHIHLQ